MLGRVEDLSHVLAWAQHSPADGEFYLGLVELPGLKMRFTPRLLAPALPMWPCDPLPHFEGHQPQIPS